MGVKNLWNVLAPAGRKISIQTLAGKKMAIDISIWIYQFSLVKRKDDNMPREVFILIGIFSRICKLLFNKIKPIFVFDGVAPHLKARELRRRQTLRDNSEQLIKSMAKQLLNMKNLPTTSINEICIKEEEKKEEDENDFSESSEDENYISIPLSFHEKRLYNSLNKEEKHLIVDTVVEPKTTISNNISDPQKFSETQIEWLQYRNEIRQNMKHLKGVDLDEKPVKRIRQTGEYYEFEKYTIDSSIFGDNNNNNDCDEDMGGGFIPESDEENENENKEKEKEEKECNNNNNNMVVDISPIRSVSSDDKTSSESGWESISISPVKPTKCEVILIKPEDVFDKDEKRESERKEDNKENKKEKIIENEVEKVKENKEDENEKEEEKEKEENNNDVVEEIPNVNRITSPLKHLQKRNNSLNNNNNNSNIISTTQIEPSIESINDISLSIISQQQQQQQQHKQENNNQQSQEQQNESISLEEKEEEENSDSENENNNYSYNNNPFPIVHSTFLNSDSLTDSQKSEDDHSYERTVMFDENISQSDLIESIIELLKLFGLPYIISPAEAEAQCAYLNYNGIVDGIISNDSDTFLFGGISVYRNFFIDYKYIEYYNINNILNELGISREDMICYGLLVGSDYAIGVNGIGSVNALEILSIFNGLNGLNDFRKWVNNNYLESDIYLKNKEFFDRKYKEKRKWILSENFPEDFIIKAYRSPKVDLSLEEISWGKIDKEKLKEYCNKVFRWNETKINDELNPIFTKESEEISQSKLDKYITIEMNEKVINVESERLKNAFIQLKQQKCLI